MEAYTICILHHTSLIWQRNTLVSQLKLVSGFGACFILVYGRLIQKLAFLIHFKASNEMVAYTYYIYPRSTHFFLTRSLKCPHNTLVSHLKLFPRFRSCLYSITPIMSLCMRDLSPILTKLCIIKTRIWCIVGNNRFYLVFPNNTKCLPILCTELTSLD